MRKSNKKSSGTPELKAELRRRQKTTRDMRRAMKEIERQGLVFDYISPGGHGTAPKSS